MHGFYEIFELKDRVVCVRGTAKILLENCMRNSIIKSIPAKESVSHNTIILVAQMIVQLICLICIVSNKNINSPLSET